MTTQTNERQKDSPGRQCLEILAQGRSWDSEVLAMSYCQNLGREEEEEAPGVRTEVSTTCLPRCIPELCLH